MRTRVRTINPVTRAGLELDRLTAKFDELSNLEIHRHRPLVGPIIGDSVLSEYVHASFVV